ncbi:MAG: transcriptional regulator, partial [Actinocrinis sp.]
QVGALTLDCDVLAVTGTDLHIMLYTAEPGTEDAERLALVTVLGTQSLGTQSLGTQPLGTQPLGTQSLVG